MINKLLVLVILILGAVLWSRAAGSYAATGNGPIAPAVANCPAPTKGFWRMCPVGSNGTYQTYVSYNGSAYTPTGW